MARAGLDRNLFGREIRNLNARTAAKTIARVKSYRDVLADYRAHQRPRSPTRTASRAIARRSDLLRRRHIRVEKDLISYIGTESNRYEEKESELDIGESSEEHFDPLNDAVKQCVLSILPEAGIANLAAKFNGWWRIA
jgi:hypothetical protein